MTNIQLRIISIAVLTVVSLLYGCMAGDTPEAKKLAENNIVYIEKVIDGDSVEANILGKREQLRLIGIDAPELGQKSWGKRSRKFLEDMVSVSGWQVRIEYDVEKRDKYDRILAYLWSRDNRLLNEEILRSGYAVLFTIPPNVKHIDRLRSAQVIARENKRGIWGRDGLKQLPSDFRKEHPRNRWKDF